MKIRTSWITVTAPLAVVVLAATLETVPVQSAQLSSSDAVREWSDTVGERSDTVREWNELALKTVQLKTLPALNDAQAARLYAMVNVAMYDAVNGIVSRHRARERRGFALVDPDGHAARPQGDLSVAAAVAAHAVLAVEFPQFRTLFPDGSPGYDAQRGDDLADAFSGSGSAAEKWGEYVGGKVRELRKGDSPVIDQPELTPPPPGKYQAKWSGINLKPFAAFKKPYPIGPGPAPLDSLEYAGAYAEVKLLGNKDIPDTQSLETYRFWSLGSGSSQPAGAWIQIALAITNENPMSLPDTTRLFALLTMALADSVGPTTMTKAKYRHWRPTAAIQGSPDDGNPYTDPQPGWVQRGALSTSPENYSGHSSFGGAGAAALAGFFCNNNIAITDFQSDSAKSASPVIAARDYPSFSAAGNEMGWSRIVGGLHFDFSNQQGLAAGRSVAEKILRHKLLLLRRSGPTHFGQCPL